MQVVGRSCHHRGPEPVSSSGKRRSPGTRKPWVGAHREQVLGGREPVAHLQGTTAQGSLAWGGWWEGSGVSADSQGLCWNRDLLGIWSGRRTGAGFSLSRPGVRTAWLVCAETWTFPQRRLGAGQGVEARLPPCVIETPAAVGPGPLGRSRGDPTDQFFLPGLVRAAWALPGQLLCLLCPGEGGALSRRGTADEGLIEGPQRPIHPAGPWQRGEVSRVRGCLALFSRDQLTPTLGGGQS